MSDQPVTLPTELLLQILENISSHSSDTFISCALATRALNAVIMPRLYTHSIVGSYDSLCKFTRTLRERPDFAALVQTLEVDMTRHFWKFGSFPKDWSPSRIPPLPNCAHIKVNPQADLFPGGPSMPFSEIAIWAASCSPTLKRLSITNLGDGSVDSDGLENSDGVDLSQTFKGVELALYDSYFSKDGEALFWKLCSPWVAKLLIVPPPDIKPSDILLDAQPMGACLTHLNLYGCEHFYADELYEQIPHLFPNMKELISPLPKRFQCSVVWHKLTALTFSVDYTYYLWSAHDVTRDDSIMCLKQGIERGAMPALKSLTLYGPTEENVAEYVLRNQEDRTELPIIPYEQKFREMTRVEPAVEAAKLDEECRTREINLQVFEQNLRLLPMWINDWIIEPSKSWGLTGEEDEEGG